MRNNVTDDASLPPTTGPCCLCAGFFHDYGHNPWPLAPEHEDGRCCDTCNLNVVAARFELMIATRPKTDDHS